MIACPPSFDFFFPPNSSNGACAPSLIWCRRPWQHEFMKCRPQATKTCQRANICFGMCFRHCRYMSTKSNDWQLKFTSPQIMQSPSALIICFIRIGRLRAPNKKILDKFNLWTGVDKVIGLHTEFRQVRATLACRGRWHVCLDDMSA